MSNRSFRLPLNHLQRLGKFKKRKRNHCLIDVILWAKRADLFRLIELFILENELPIYKDDMAVKNGQLSKSNIEKNVIWNFGFFFMEIFECL